MRQSQISPMLVNLPQMKAIKKYNQKNEAESQTQSRFLMSFKMV